MTEQKQKSTSAIVLAVWVVSISMPLFSGSVAYAESSCPTADSACDEYDDEAEWVSAICKDPDPMPTNVTVTEYESAKAVCKENAKIAWGQVGPGCNVLHFSDLQKVDQIWLAGSYSVVAAACLTAWALEQSGVAAGFGAAMHGICAAGSIVVGGFDMGFTIGRKNEAEEALSGVTFMDVATGLVAAAGAGVTNGAIQIFGKAGGNVQKTSSFLTFALTAAIAGAKWSSLGSIDATKESACQLIVDQASNVLTLSGSTLLPDTDTGNAISSSGTSGGTVASGSSTGTGDSKSGGEALKKMFSSPEAFAAAATSVGKIDPKLGEFFKKQSPKDLFNQMKAVNPNFEKVAMAAAQGSFSGAAAALGNLAPKDQKLTDALKTADSELKKRLSAQNAKLAAEMSYGKGGAGAKAGAAAKTAANPFGFGFGMSGGDGAAGGADALKFTGAAKVAEPVIEAVGDIYHSAEKGSIFQIVSRRLGRAQEKVEAYEWDSPGNRVRQNLPWKPATEGLRKPAAVGTQ